jgi:hypothetical protein
MRTGGNEPSQPPLGCLGGCYIKLAFSNRKTSDNSTHRLIATTFEVNVYSVMTFFLFPKMGTAPGCCPVTMT